MTQTAILPDWMQQRLAGDVEQPGEVVIAPDEQAALGLFLALATQWRLCPVTGQRRALDYTAITPSAEMIDTEMTPMLFRDLRVMEGAALAAIAERRVR